MSDRRILVGLILDGKEYQVDVTDESLVMTSLGKNVSLLESKELVFLISAEVLRHPDNRHTNQVMVFTKAEWALLSNATPYNLYSGKKD